MIVWYNLRARRLRLGLVLGAAMLPMGCASGGYDPVAWMHNYEGGEIAKERPPAPLADAPYPNLASVPERPPAPDEKARAAIAKALVADRANAQYAQTIAALPPLPPVEKPPPAPGAEESAGATMQAAAAPARPAPHVQVAGTQQAAAPAKTAAPGLSGAEKVLQPMREGRAAEPLETLPPLAEAPPPPARLGGVPATTAPAPPPQAPAGFVAPSAVASAAKAPAAPAATPAPATSLRIGFPPGSDTLPGDALASLKALAHERGTHGIVVTGFGDVANSDASAQTAGLSLALSRARSVASYLIAVGVPPAILRVGAEAQGQGAAVRLAD